jgi:hypothetical protein
LIAGKQNRLTISVTSAQSYTLYEDANRAAAMGAGGVKTATRLLQPGSLQAGPRLRVNWQHPLAGGLVHLEMFDQLRQTDDPFLPQMIGSHGT